MKVANDVIRFCLELAALAALGACAWQATPGTTRWIAVIAAPLAAAAFWGWLMAPKSVHRLDDPYRFLLELAFFATAFLALAAARRPGIALALALVAAVNLPLDRVLANA